MPALIGAAFFVAASLVYGMGTLSASMPRWLVLYGWGSVACVVFVVHLWKEGWRRDRIDVLALALLLWMGLSLFWSADWRQGAFELTNAVAVFAVFCWVRRYPDWIPEAALIALVGTMTLQVLYPEDWGGHGNRNFITEAVLLLLALSGEMRRLKWAWCLAMPGALAVLWVSPSKIEIAALLCLVLYYGPKFYRVHYRPA